jgi:NNP family nitrate/nitrite transporter-like MFS transporter
MRAFHCSWWCFFIAFFIWFAIAPLLSEIKSTLNLTKEEVWTSSIVGVGGTIMMRFVLGPLCDKFGARVLFTGVLCVASIPTALTGLVNSAAGLAILRLFIGIAGGTFVMCQYWSSRMFTKDVVGTANALCGGWGNLGGGVTQLVMGSVLFPLFKEIFSGSDDPAEMAWRTVSVVPAVVAFGSGVAVYFISDDAPKGNYSELKRHGAMPEVSAAASFRSGAINFNTWLLFLQYACCFGVELTMNNAAALYFKDEFGQSTESAAAIASIFGWMNLFARGLGGFFSDKANAKMGMRGRIAVQTVLLLLEGVMVIVFANTGSLGVAIFVMLIFSVFVQAAEGSTYGIVPYVDPPSTGSISGIVGAGGNTGAVLFGLGFRQMDYYDAFILMGSVIIVSSICSIFIFIKGHAGLVCGKDDPLITGKNKDAGVLAVPEAEEEPVSEEIDC